MIDADKTPKLLFELALREEGTTERALRALARSGQIAEVYLGPHVSQPLADSFVGLDSSMTARTCDLSSTEK